jgi:hypothetical protein
LNESEHRYNDDALSHPVPLCESQGGLTGQHRAACAVAAMWQRSGDDVVQRDDGRFDVVMPEPINAIRVCAFERLHDLIVSEDDEARCFVLVWSTGDADVFDVRGVVSAKRLREICKRDDGKLILREQALSRPEALKLEYNRWVTLDVPLN